MKTEQRLWTPAKGWTTHSAPGLLEPDLVLAFGAGERLADEGAFRELRQHYPTGRLVCCSTAGEIYGTEVHDDSIVVTAIDFDRTDVRVAETSTSDQPSSHAVGQKLASMLAGQGLRHVVVISDGLRVNGSELALGLRESLPATVAVTGGLSGDGARFGRTVVGLDAPAVEGKVVAIGLYGDSLRIGYGSLGGWDSFGPERQITRSSGNVLYELDGQSALELYKNYLGEHATGLPATGLLFPLSVRSRDGSASLVRTILAVNESERSMTFAGDVPQGWYARLMKANFDRLIDGATGAARDSQIALAGSNPDLALLISCVGRKLVLKQRVEEELESVREVLGPGATLMGFYSYGEICPAAPSASCELHNQTMTITTFTEA
jgi:hypothetical protein